MEKQEVLNAVTEVYDKFKALRAHYDTITSNWNNKQYSSTGLYISDLLDLRDGFTNLYADIIPIKGFMYEIRNERSDAHRSAFRYTLATQIEKGELEGYEKCRANAAEKLATTTQQYRTFLREQSIYKRFAFNIGDTVDSINHYINAVASRVSKLYSPAEEHKEETKDW